MADLPGVHQRSTYVALVYGLFCARRSGVLEVRSGRSWRRFYFVSGRVAWYSSDKLEEELARTLVKVGMVSVKQMQSLTAKSSPFEPVSERLLAAGLVKPQELEDHRTQQLAPAVAAPLGWSSGEWSFQRRDSLELNAIDPALFPVTNVLQGLWMGVRAYVQMEEALQGVGTRHDVKLVPAAGLDEAIDVLPLEGPLAEIRAALGAGQTVEGLFREIPDRSGSLMQLLWLLSSCGLLAVADVAPDVVKALLCTGKDLVKAAKLQLGLRRVEEAKATASSARGAETKKSATAKKDAAAKKKGVSRKQEALPLEEPGRQQATKPAASPASATQRSQSSHLAKLIETAHSHRMGKSFYGFFDLDKRASADAVRDAYERLTRGWKAAAADERLEEEDYARVQELLHAAQLVWQTLSEPASRKRYDERAALGTAPRLESQLAMFMASVRAQSDKTALSSQSSSPQASGGPAHTKARALMKRGDYAAALVHLKELRQSKGSNPDVLSDLGWCCWKVYGKASPGDGDEDGAEDLLLLAQTFDASHAKAMEYLGRMAREQGDEDRTLLWAQRLLKTHPRSQWAGQMLATLRSEGVGSKIVTSRDSKRG